MEVHKKKKKKKITITIIIEKNASSFFTFPIK